MDSCKYPGLAADFERDPLASAAKDTLVKQTLLLLPGFSAIYPTFSVSLHKLFRGLPSSSTNDEGDQDLVPAEEDSQIDVFDDGVDELLLDLEPQNAPQKESDQSDIQTVKVIVKTASLLVNGVEFPLNTAARDSCVVKGASYGNRQEEDSLVVSVKSGFIFLIRVFHVPRDYNDTFYDAQNGPEELKNMVFKPFIVQWWDSCNQQSTPPQEASGNALSSHAGGLSVVSTSPADVFRIYNCENTDLGLLLLPHINVPVEGVILHSCFAAPRSASDHYVWFLALVFTNNRRLELNLFGWLPSSDQQNAISRSMLPLNNEFEIPVFVVPLKKSNGFLFVTPKTLSLITIHNITSAEYNFVSAPFNGSFPTSHYCASKPIICDDETADEVLISTDSGVIHSVIVINGATIVLRPILRVTDPISVFTMEKNNNGYTLIFGCDTGSNREVLVTELFQEEYTRSLLPGQKPKYSGIQIRTDYKNWSPILDVQIIPSYRSRTVPSVTDRELWALTGSGKRTRLSQLRSGYIAQRVSQSYDRLRKANNIFHINFLERSFIFCPFAFETVVLEYQAGEEEELVELEGFNLFTEESSLLIAPLGEFILQITQNRVIVSNLLEHVSVKAEGSIVLCDMINDYVALLVENQKRLTLEIMRLSKDFTFESLSDEAFVPISSIELTEEVSSVKLGSNGSEVYIFVGNYLGNISIYSIELPVPKKIISLADHNPYTVDGLFRDPMIIPHDAILTSNYLFIGTKDGYYIHLEISPNFVVQCKNFLKIGDSPVLLVLSKDDSRLLFAHSRSLWLFNFYESKFPMKVYFEEKTERAISAMVEIPLASGNGMANTQFGFIREEGFTVTSISTFKTPFVKHVSVLEPAKKFIYLSNISVFVIMCLSKETTGRLKFIDRKTLRTLPQREVLYKRKEGTSKNSIFAANEVPLCACIWSVQRQGRTSKKLLVGSMLNENSGSFKVLDVTKTVSPEDQSARIKVTELNAFEHKEPITCIAQLGSLILFSSASTIYSTTYDNAERRLRPVSQLQKLTSEVTALSLGNDNTLLVTTKSDSTLQFTYKGDHSEGGLLLDLKDPSPKSLVNQVQVGSRIFAGEKLHSSLIVMDIELLAMVGHMSLQLSGIPRVFSSRFNSVWNENDPLYNDTSEEPNVLCVGVNGEVIVVRETASDGPELTSLVQKMNSGNPKAGDLLTSLVSRLDRPFLDKVTGKGLRSIYKPYFDFRDNRGKLVDYDLEELSAICAANISL